jgi:hypothetical protein
MKKKQGHFWSLPVLFTSAVNLNCPRLANLYPHDGTPGEPAVNEHFVILTYTHA